MSLARPFRIVCAALLVGAYVAAATTPCPAMQAVAPLSSHAPHFAAHPAHPHRGAGTADPVRAASAAVISAPCVCGCGRRAGTVSMARLGPLLLSEVVAIAFPPASAHDGSLVPRAVSIALAPPDPVPISIFA